MKIRYGFVSNSSSTSFTCDVCGIEDSGMDMNLQDVGMARCRNGHTLCLEHMPGEGEILENRMTREVLLAWLAQSSSSWDAERYIQLLAITDAEYDDGYDQEWSDYQYEFRDSFPTQYCPICGFRVVYLPDIARYLLKQSGQTEQELLAKLADAFGSYQAFEEYIK